MSAERGAGYSWSCGFASLSTSLKLFHALGSADDASLRCTQVAGTMSCNAGAGVQLLGRYVYLLLQCVRLQASFNHAHRQRFAGLAPRSGGTKCLNADSAWPLSKDCSTFHLSGTRQVRSMHQICCCQTVKGFQRPAFVLQQSSQDCTALVKICQSIV